MKGMEEWQHVYVLIFYRGVCVEMEGCGLVGGGGNEGIFPLLSSE